jgi:signal transduction histidine kinase
VRYNNTAVFRRRPRPSLPVLTILISLVALLVTGAFLYRWVNRLSQLDYRRRKEDLDNAAANLQREFSATIHEAIWYFHPVPGMQPVSPQETYAELYAQWKTLTRWPQLIEGIGLAFKSPDGSIKFERLQPATGRFAAASWPSAFTSFRQSLTSPHRDVKLERHVLALAPTYVSFDGNPWFAIPMVEPRRVTARSRLARRVGALFLLRGESPGAFTAHVVQPASKHNLPPPVPPPQPGALEFYGGAEHPRLAGWCFLELNEPFVRTQLLPFLVDRYFGSQELANFNVGVVTGKPARLIYASNPAITPSSLQPADARVGLFSPNARIGVFLHTLWAGMAHASRRARIRGSRLQPPREQVEARWNAYAGAEPESWRLLVRDRLGSLAIDVARDRRRNLAIGFGALLLLASTIAALVVAMIRAHALARRQMEFVAGISHELRTPLAVIESGAFNLASGKVDGAERVRKYGETIQNEGRRLSALIGHTLAYAGIQAGRQQYAFKSVHILDVVNSVLAGYERDLNQENWHVEKMLESNLPLVSADAPVLESDIKNLIGNAFKYASSGKWLRITARTVEAWRGSEVQVAIADHGPGIAHEDLPHIFEPFYRGRNVVASTVAGAGLGLSLVRRHMQAHGGDVTVQSTNGTGAEFILHLPVK